MNTLKDIRGRLGITQREMARLLRITRSYLSAIELGERKLPANVYLQLAEIEKKMQDSDPINESAMLDAVQNTNEIAIQSFNAEIESDQIRLNNLIEKLEKMKLNNLHAKNKLNFICKEMLKYSSDSIEFRLLENDKNIAEKNYIDTLPIHQQILIIEIESFQQLIAIKSAKLLSLKS